MLTVAFFLGKNADLPQPRVRENLESHEKNLQILQKVVRFYFSVPDQIAFPSRELDTNLIPRAYSPFKLADRRGEKR